MASRSVANIRRQIDETMALPLTQPDEAKLRGPELGARVRSTSSGSTHGKLGTVTRRWYLWAPDSRNGSTRGIVRYDDSVVDFDDGPTLVMLDRDLEVGDWTTTEELIDGEVVEVVVSTLDLHR